MKYQSKVNGVIILHNMLLILIISSTIAIYWFEIYGDRNQYWHLKY